MKINIAHTSLGMATLIELLEFKEINEGFFILLEEPEFADLKKGEIYHLELGAPIATKIQSLAEFVKDTFSKEEVEQLMINLKA